MIAQFDAYMRELTEWNKVMNLTAIREPEDVIDRHFIDSISLLRADTPKKGAKLADVGSGAGFPAIPLKIVRPDLEITCIDGLGKRITFLTHLAEALDLKGCSFLHLRAEEAGRKAGLRETFDLVTARAVAEMNVLAEYCLPLVKKDGVFVAMKGNLTEEEKGRGEKASEILGGKVTKSFFFSLPDTDISRTLLRVEKHRGTAAKYPRVGTKIAQAPL